MLFDVHIQIFQLPSPPAPPQHPQHVDMFLDCLIILYHKALVILFQYVWYRSLVQVKSVGKFKETKRTHGISTSDIIMRLLKDYNQYAMRNLARGYTRKDLGVSYVKVFPCLCITSFKHYLRYLFLCVNWSLSRYFLLSGKTA